MKKRLIIHPLLRQLMRITLLQSLLITVSLTFSYGHKSHSQELMDRTVTVKAENVEIRKILTQIERQTKVKFVYSSNAIGAERKVSVRVIDSKLSDVLDKTLRPLQISYRLIGGQIMLHPGAGDSSEEPPSGDVPLEKAISGTITDENGNGLPGVSILLKDTQHGTSTNATGAFSIVVPDEHAILILSFVGYVSQEITVGDQSQFNVSLLPDQKALEEVIVVGYGTQKKSTLTGAIAAIKSEEILKSPTSNVTNSLTGRMPGVFTFQRSGKPGFNQADILIRGRSTTGNASPLIIVDGSERPTFGDIDPNEIETISVLKDASATALFGIKGGNGVILITTKVGQEGKARISYSGNLALQSYVNLPQILDAYTAASLLNEANANIGKEPAFSEIELMKYRDGSDPIRYPDVDWFDYLTRKVYPQHQHNINISGGSKIAKYFVSMGYLHEDGFFKKFDTPYGYRTTPFYNRYNIRSNFDINLNKDLVFSVKLGTRFEKRYTPAGNANSATDGEIEYLLHRINGLPSYGFAPMLPDGRLLENPSVGVNLFNPLGFLTRRGYGIKMNNAIESTLALNYNLKNLLEGLTFRTQLAYDAYYFAERRQNGNYASYVINQVTGDVTLNGTVQDTPLSGLVSAYNGTLNSNWQTSLNYSNNFQRHGVTGLFLFQRQSSKVAGAQAPFASQGFVGRLTYNFDDRYYVEFNGAYNGSENFAPTRRYGFFPALSAGWNVSNERFLKQLNWLTLLKVRGSIGKIGFDKIGGNRFLYLDEYGRTSTVTSGQGLYSKPNTATQFGLPSSVVTYPSVIHSRIGNPFITWETSTKRNIGFESNFFNGLLVLNADYFNENRTGLLLNRQSGLVTYGEAYPSVNLGEVYNYGYEIELRHDNRIGGIRYGIASHLSFARNKILNVDEPSNRPDYQKAAGHRIGQIRGYRTEGFYQSQTDIDDSPVNRLGRPIPGDLKFTDYDEDGAITSDDQVPIGYSNIPEYTFSTEPSVHWKQFSASVMFQGVANVSSNVQWNQRENNGNQMYEHMLGRWTPENSQNATWPALQPAIGGNFMSYNSNDFLLTNANYIKLRNAQISYLFSKDLASKLGLSSLRVTLSGQNLITWTQMRYLDPESSTKFVYPISRIYNLRLNLDL